MPDQAGSQHAASGQRAGMHQACARLWKAEKTFGQSASGMREHGRASHCWDTSHSSEMPWTVTGSTCREKEVAAFVVKRHEGRQLAMAAQLREKGKGGDGAEGVSRHVLQPWCVAYFRGEFSYVGELAALAGSPESEQRHRAKVNCLWSV
jgi:hypothetical protein